jgi:hypothetical protein
MPSTDLRSEVAANYDADLAAKLRSSKVYDFYKTMGRKLEGMDLDEVKQAGWDDETIRTFNLLLDEDRAAGTSTSLGEDLNKGLVEAGLNTERTVSDGQDLITVTGRAE